MSRLVSATVLAYLLAACEGGDATLVVQVRTDLAPGLELASVRVVVEGGATRETPSSASRDWGLGVRVAELTLPRGTHRLRVAALDGDGAVVVERPVRAELSGGVRVVTVLLTRDCAGVRCPGAGDDAEAVACLGGRCVLASCEEEAAASCAAECTSASSCGAASAACAAVECTASGTCFEAPDHARCAGGDVCVLGDGCVPADRADGGAGEDAGACEIPCGLLPQCGCGAADACRLGVAGSFCDAAGAGGDRALCATDVDCAAGLECYLAGGHCVAYCRAGADCASGETCAYSSVAFPVGACVGDPCDPVAGGPCGAGKTCRLLDAWDSTGAPIRPASCDLHGALARSQPCFAPTDCGPGLACYDAGTGPFCRPYCLGAADCGSTDSLCAPAGHVAAPPGHCTDACDLLDGSGCGAGACRLRTITAFDGTPDVQVKLCATAAGSGTDGASCATDDDCAGGFACALGACRQFCDRAAPSCMRGSCLGIMPPLSVGGVSYGLCN